MSRKMSELLVGDLVSWNGRDRLGDELVVAVIHDNGKTCMIYNHSCHWWEPNISELEINYESPLRKALKEIESKDKRIAELKADNRKLEEIITSFINDVDLESEDFPWHIQAVFEEHEHNFKEFINLQKKASRV